MAPSKMAQTDDKCTALAQLALARMDNTDAVAEEAPDVALGPVPDLEDVDQALAPGRDVAPVTALGQVQD